MSFFIQQHYSHCDFPANESWIILSSIEQSIKRKIEAIGIPLKDWNIKINYGIKTGFNDAFIISTEKRNEILSKCIDETEEQRTAEIIRRKKYTIQELLIPNPSNDLIETICSYVESYISGLISIKELAELANSKIYQITGLNPEEIKYVENFYPALL